mgnify:CR=1 FL=1
MPNQRDPNIKVTSIAINKEILKEVEKLARRCDRSRNKVMELILRNEVPRYLAQDIDPSRLPKYD